MPCYTEGETLLRRTIDSLTQLKYNDKRKLTLVVCDGDIFGSGNDRPTPCIVLDILGADPNLEPEALSFISSGEGARQHNMGKVYSGLYECSGHVVPYLVVVKIDTPGNRGKRDSQMVIKHCSFLSVLARSCWFSLVLIGSRSFSLVLARSHWFLLVLIGSHLFALVLIGYVFVLVRVHSCSFVFHVYRIIYSCS